MSESNDDNGSSIDLNDLSDEQKESLMSHPEVKKMLEYEETSIPQVADMLGNLVAEEFELDSEDKPETTYEVLVAGISDRRGRVTRQTVHKVLTGFIEEYQDSKQ